MKKFSAVFLCLCVCLFLVACKRLPETISVSEQTDATDTEPTEETTFTPVYSSAAFFETIVFTDEDTNEDVQYLFHEPLREEDRSYPLIIFLHGLGDTVDEFSLGTATSFAHALMDLENESEKYGAYVLIPSTPFSYEGWWTWSQLEAFKKLIYELTENYKIDTGRIYITGISMGGFTTCQLVNEMPPNTFAAAVPLSGAYNMTAPETLFNTAFRIYHSTYDSVVDVSTSRALHQQLVDCEHPQTTYVEFEHGDHISPLYSVYTDDRQAFFDWLFAQKITIFDKWKNR